MLKRVRQVTGNALTNVFEEGKWPLDRPGHQGPIYRFFNPIQNEVYQERHQLANQRLNLLGSVSEKDKQALAVIETRLTQLRSQGEKAGLSTEEFRRRLKEEKEADNSPQEGDSIYESFRKEKERAKEGKRGGGKETG